MPWTDGVCLLSVFRQLLAFLLFAKSERHLQSILLDFTLVERKLLYPSNIIDIERQGPLWAYGKLLGTLYNTVSKEKLT